MTRSPPSKVKTMNAPTEASVVDALARERFLPFLMLVFEVLHPGQQPLKPSWYLRAIAYWLERVESGKLLRSMIWIQPRALKSIAVSVAFPCWLMGRDPTRQIMVATYSDGLGTTHAQHRKRILESEFYKRLFPAVEVARDGNRLMDLLMTAGGRIRAVSVEGTITGHGANIIILDDCMKPEDTRSAVLRERIKRWYESTISTRTIDERASIISIQQRLHEDDLPAFLRDKGFLCLCLPARAPIDIRVEIGPDQTYLWRRNELLCPELLSEEGLERKRFEHGAQEFAAQFLQDPIAPEGNLLRMEHFRRFEVEMVRDDFEKVFQSWDTAYSDSPTADWSVCTTWGYLCGRLFLLHIFRARLEFGPLKQMVIALQARWRADHVIIEKAGSGYSLWQEFRRTTKFTVVGWPTSSNSAERLLAQSGQIEEGRVWLPAQLAGLDEFIHELKGFPAVTHDDQVDTLTQVLEYIMYRWRTAETPLTASGRREYVNRMRERPPLPPLPDWIV